MNKIILPDNCNYIGVFLTLRCNLNCDYCINRQGDFVMPDEMTPNNWIKGLYGIKTRQDLPISIQGGEPTIYEGFYRICNELYNWDAKNLDLLTNGTFELRKFTKEISPSIFKRRAKYTSIRFSYHKDMNPIALVMKVWELQNRGYEVGIWGLDCNDNSEIKHLCEGLNIDFRIKEYLDKNNGTYKYPDAVNRPVLSKVQCKTSEFLIGPSGHLFRCHADLYANRNPYGHLLDEEIKFPEFLECDRYGQCNPCDVKIKTNRHQVYGYTSVEIVG